MVYSKSESSLQSEVISSRRSIVPPICRSSVSCKSHRAALPPLWWRRVFHFFADVLASIVHLAKPRSCHR